MNKNDANLWDSNLLQEVAMFTDLKWVITAIFMHCTPSKCYLKFQYFVRNELHFNLPTVVFELYDTVSPPQVLHVVLRFERTQNASERFIQQVYKYHKKYRHKYNK